MRRLNRVRHKSMSNLRALTLIELLVVVAIIAVLASIAVPNFLEAQTRSKVSRAKADMRTIMTALESYRVDTTSYPEDYAATTPRGDGMGRLTTPVSYLSSVPLDVFGGYYDSDQAVQVKSYSLGTAPDDAPSRWALASSGPDRKDDTTPLFDYPGYNEPMWENPSSGYSYYRYDATNGTVSRGDIIRLSDYGGES